MTTRMNLKTVSIGEHKLVSYRDNPKEKIKICAGISYWFLVEEGFVPKGGKKERLDIGEVPDSIIFLSDDDKLGFEFDNGANMINNVWEPRISLDYLVELSNHCKQENLEHEEAHEYFYDQIYQRNSREVGWNQYEIDERKNKVIDICLKRFRKD